MTILILFTFSIETVKASSISNFFEDAKFGIPDLPQSLDITQHLDGILRILRSIVSLLKKENYHNSKSSNDNDIKPEPIIRIDMGKTATSKIYLSLVITLRILFHLISKRSSKAHS